LNPELVKILGAAARYRRVTVGSSPDYAQPDNLTPHIDKVYSSPLHISGLDFLMLRTRRGAAATTWASRLSTCEKNN
jgi:hypothetical protein